ncbi:YhbY family RNA-binding protein [Atopomonas sediminilitoris]|uniref:YhbY family RNA-binding protein n=1 Tax=Atopomonas sediminilitoris TaxID=2919919 RepID=UPI001F4EC8B2|nr:YhbY family RNA-binding protein [Atopomonas sediminilitoris]MCJ8170713.1 YhbY family RNA-binding protein [Atopomonas sediminilitoris]
MSLTQDQKKRFKQIGHHLKPVVMVAGNGLSEGVVSETERALHDHELIKVRFSITEREPRLELMNALCQQVNADLVQIIGKLALIYRVNRKANPKLSNVKRFAE